MTCKHCKYWEVREGRGEEKNLGIKRCTRVKMFWDCTEWGDESNNYERIFTKEASSNKAFLQDGSDYKAHLLTLGDFGCNQFESL